MIKAIGAVMTGFAGAYFGIKLSANLRTRAGSLADICASLELLESEISFSVNKLKKAFIRADRNGLFTLAAGNLERMSAKKAWDNALCDMQSKLCLRKADIDILGQLGQNIGKTDTEDQLKNIRYIKNIAMQQEKQARADYDRFGKLYRNGGVLIGLLAVIILI